MSDDEYDRELDARDRSAEHGGAGAGYPAPARRQHLTADGREKLRAIGVDPDEVDLSHLFDCGDPLDHMTTPERGHTMIELTDEQKAVQDGYAGRYATIAVSALAPRGVGAVLMVALAHSPAPDCEDEAVNRALKWIYKGIGNRDEIGGCEVARVLPDGRITDPWPWIRDRIESEGA